MAFRFQNRLVIFIIKILGISRPKSCSIILNVLGLSLVDFHNLTPSIALLILLLIRNFQMFPIKWFKQFAFYRHII